MKYCCQIGWSEPVVVVELRDLLRRRARAEGGPGGAVRKQVQQHEDDHRHEQQDDNRLPGPLQQEPGHWVRYQYSGTRLRIGFQTTPPTLIDVAWIV